MHFKLAKETEIITVEANNKAKELKIKTEAEAFATKTAAQAKADSIIIQAEAGKQAKVLAGKGESEYATLVT